MCQPSRTTFACGHTTITSGTCPAFPLCPSVLRPSSSTPINPCDECLDRHDEHSTLRLKILDRMRRDEEWYWLEKSRIAIQGKNDRRMLASLGLRTMSSREGRRSLLFPVTMPLTAVAVTGTTAVAVVPARIGLARSGSMATLEDFGDCEDREYREDRPVVMVEDEDGSVEDEFIGAGGMGGFGIVVPAYGPASMVVEESGQRARLRRREQRDVEVRKKEERRVWFGNTEME